MFIHGDTKIGLLVANVQKNQQPKEIKIFISFLINERAPIVVFLLVVTCSVTVIAIMSYSYKKS